MSDINIRFKTFLNNIALTESQKEDAKRKYDNVCKTLHNYYYPYSSYTGSTKFLVGSYAKNTAIRPPGDVDVIFKIPWSTYDHYSKLKTGCRGLINEVKTVLSSTFITTDRIRPNGMVVEVDFNTFSVEVLPAFEWTFDDWNGTFSVPIITYDLSSIFSLGTGSNLLENNSWKRIDPRKEHDELLCSNKYYNGNTKCLSKMLKKWISNCNVSIKSVVIERLLIEFLRISIYSKNSFVYYDYLTRDFFKFLIDSKNKYVSLPGINEDIAIGDSWLSKAETAYKRACKACDYEAAKKDFDAAYEWKKIFGNDYPY